MKIIVMARPDGTMFTRTPVEPMRKAETEDEYALYLGHMKAGIPEERARQLAALGYEPRVKFAGRPEPDADVLTEHEIALYTRLLKDGNTEEFAMEVLALRRRTGGA